MYCLIFAFMSAILLGVDSDVDAQDASQFGETDGSAAQWTGLGDAGNTNDWFAFRNDFIPDELSGSAVLADIAADSKCWLWINGEQVILEGGLKRGPNPSGTYFDRVDIGPYLHQGSYSVAVLMWHFGKKGFSNHDSGTAGVMFDAQVGGETVLRDSSWRVRDDIVFGTESVPAPSFLLPESNLRYDDRHDIEDRQAPSFQTGRAWAAATQLEAAGQGPCEGLVERSAPQWRDYDKVWESGSATGIANSLMGFRLGNNGCLSYQAQAGNSLFEMGGEQAGYFTTRSWQGDGDLQLDSSQIYTHAIDFMSGGPFDQAVGTATVDCITFTQESVGLGFVGSSPISGNDQSSGAGWSINGIVFGFENTGNNRMFGVDSSRLSDALVAGGDEQVLNLEGLEENTDYILTWFSPLCGDHVNRSTILDGGDDGFSRGSTISVLQDADAEALIYEYRYNSRDSTAVSLVFDYCNVDTTHHYAFMNRLASPLESVLSVILQGDLDGDGNDAEYSLVFAAFTGPDSGPSGNPNAGLDGDGDIDDADFGFAFAAFTGPTGSSVNVPEPSGLAVLGVVVVDGRQAMRSAEIGAISACCIWLGCHREDWFGVVIERILDTWGHRILQSICKCSGVDCEG